MGVIRNSDVRHSTFHKIDILMGHECFFCGDELWRTADGDETAVYWHGHSEVPIYLHADCAKDFALHLISDANAATNYNNSGTCVLPAHKALKG